MRNTAPPGNFKPLPSMVAAGPELFQRRRTVMLVLCCVPTSPNPFANASPRRFTCARGGWDLEVPVEMKIEFGKLLLFVPVD
jgi:hypothetical protein